MSVLKLGHILPSLTSVSTGLQSDVQDRRSDVMMDMPHLTRGGATGREHKGKGKGIGGETPRLATTQACLNVLHGRIATSKSRACTCTLYSALRPANLRPCVYTRVIKLNVRVHVVLGVINVLLFG
jgi:hypothetical protein